MNSAVNSLKSSGRLKSKKLFEEVFSQGKWIKSNDISVVYLNVEPKPGIPLQAAFSVPKRKFKKAVDRNRLKRLLREAYRTQKQELEEVLKTSNKALVIVFVFTFTQLIEYDRVQTNVSQVLQTLLKHVTK